MKRKAPSAIEDILASVFHQITPKARVRKALPSVKRGQALGMGRGGNRPDPASKRYTDERLHLLIDPMEKRAAQLDAASNEISFANWVRFALRRVRGAQVTEAERSLLRTQGAKKK